MSTRLFIHFLIVSVTILCVFGQGGDGKSIGKVEINQRRQQRLGYCNLPENAETHTINEEEKLLPPPDILAYTVAPCFLAKHRMAIRPDFKDLAEKIIGGTDADSSHNIIATSEIQFELALNHAMDTVLLFFWGTTSREDVETDLAMSHEQRYVGDKIINVHAGVVKKFEESNFWRIFQNELKILLTKRNTNEQVVPTKFIISGHSLGISVSTISLIWTYTPNID